MTLAYLEMIQSIVSRMATHAFMVKGWAITIAAALLAYSGATANTWPIAVALFTTAGFWALDAYYLRRERMFRCLFDHVRRRWPENDCKVGDFDLSTKGFGKHVGPLWCVLFAPALLGLYVPILVALWAMSRFA